MAVVLPNPLKRRDLSPHARAFVGHGASLALNLLFILLIARDLAFLTWHILWPEKPALVVPDVRQPLSVRHTQAFATHGDSRFSSESLHATVGLFGEDFQPPPVPQRHEIPSERSDTPLPLTLLGIYFVDGQASRALIGQPGAREKVYQTGDLLPGPAHIVAIYPDRVIVKRQHKQEILRLPKEGDPTTLTASRRGGTAQLSPDVNAEVTEIWHQFRQRPESMLDRVRLEPAMVGGTFKGVRIFSGADKNFLGKFGLRSGDLVTWINGVALTSPLKGMAVLGELASTETLRFRVQRGAASHAYDFYLSGQPTGPAR